MAKTKESFRTFILCSVTAYTRKENYKACSKHFQVPGATECHCMVQEVEAKTVPLQETVLPIMDTELERLNSKPPAILWFHKIKVDIFFGHRYLAFIFGKRIEKLIDRLLYVLKLTF